MDISLISIIETTTRAIGKDGNLLISFKEDIRRFKSLTEGNIVVMGSTTFYKDLKGKPLPNRLNVVLTSNLNVNRLPHNVVLLNMLPLQVITFLSETYKNKHIFIIGGQSIYEQFIEYATTIYLTEFTDSSLIGDKFFPVIDNEHWIITSEEVVNNLTFKTYSKY